MSTQKGFAGWVAFVVVAAVCLAAPITAAKLPSYIVDKGIGFEAHTNRQWRAEGAGQARELAKYDPGGLTTADRSFRIWTPTCKPGQKVHFTRKLDLLGRPSSIYASTYAGLSVDYYEIFLNGRKAAHFGPTQSPGLDAKDARLLHPGLNDVDLVVKLTTFASACTGESVRSNRGVWLKLGGYFATDLSVGGPKPGEEIVYQTKVGSVVSIRIVNEGPSKIPRGTFQVRTSGHGSCVDDPPIDPCKNFQFMLFYLPTFSEGEVKCKPDNTGYQIIDCTFTDLPVGKTYRVVVGLKYKVDPTQPVWVEEDTLLSWTASIPAGGPGELDYANNAASYGTHFCQYGVVDGKACKTSP